jgi:hypothetical protein
LADEGEDGRVVRGGAVERFEEGVELGPREVVKGRGEVKEDRQWIFMAADFVREYEVGVGVVTGAEPGLTGVEVHPWLRVVGPSFHEDPFIDAAEDGREGNGSGLGGNGVLGVFDEQVEAAVGPVRGNETSGSTEFEEGRQGSDKGGG